MPEPSPEAQDNMAPRNLLLCFDAFGTLFKPRRPIAQQYGEVARSLGHSGFSDEDVLSSFTTAFKREAKQNPNYGKANGMDPEQWWTNIITNTFQPLIEPGKSLHRELVPKLLHRFWCDEGYLLFPDVVPLLQRLRNAHRADNTRVVVGVITNSDVRVPDVLSSLGMRVSPSRYGGQPVPAFAVDNQYDIDFSVMSYDVEHEKPDKRMFHAAEEMLKAILEADSGGKHSDNDPREWRKVYIGDEYDKDVTGALNAGWNAILIDRENSKRDGVVWLDDQSTSSWSELFKTSKAVGFNSLAELAKWLPPKL